LASEDEIADLLAILLVLKSVQDPYEKNGGRCEPLLAVNDACLGSLSGDYDRTKKIGWIFRNVAAAMRGFPCGKKAAREIGEFLNLLRPPARLSG